MVYVTLGASWDDGTTLAEIEVARQLLIQDMKILEGIAPESGAYFNEVSFPRAHTRTRHLVPLFSPICLSPLALVGFEIRIRLEEILLWQSLRQAPDHQAEIRSELYLPRSRGYRIRRVGRRSRLPSLRPLRNATPPRLRSSVTLGNFCYSCIARITRTF